MAGMVAKGALAQRMTAGSAVGERRSARDLKVDTSSPPWRKWRTRSRAARCIRFIETYCRVPMGFGAGTLIRLAPFQKHMLEAELAEDVRNGAVQIPRGNAKSTLWSAVGLWATADFEDSPSVPLVAQTVTRAYENLLLPAALMIAADPELESRLVTYHAFSDRRIWSGWNNGRCRPMPAEANRLQGLNPTVALIDEAQTLEPAVVRAVQLAAGKRPNSLVLSIGTPAPDARTSALYDLRERMLEGAPLAWVEHAADDGCDHGDRAQWRKANPAIAAGFLDIAALEDDYRLQPEAEFRMYRLGQWTDFTEAGWLPAGAWSDCPREPAPPDGSEIVLALAGTWQSSIALVGSTLDGALFLAYWSENVSDDELAEVLADAWSRWQVSSLTVSARTRANLIRRLADDGLPVDYWPNRIELEAQAATDFRRAIIDRKVAHDGDPELETQLCALRASSTIDGSLRLVVPSDGRLADAGRAALMAWWRAIEQGSTAAPAVY